ncbi:MAG: serine protease [Proteobacteria bacterium]|nr:serine protease [Pseudomonadota bacterium]
MKIIPIILGLAVLHTPAFSQSSIVKVISHPCNEEIYDLGTRVGSGVLIKDSTSSQTYVVTAAHVPWNDGKSEGYCHKATESVNGESFDLEFIAAHFLKDLSVLKIKSPSTQLADQAHELQSLTAVETSVDSAVLAIGYPQSQERAATYPGRVTVARSPFPLSPNTDYIESSGVTEKGMSGGGLFTADGKLLGILSHHMRVYPLGGESFLFQRNFNSLNAQIWNLSINSHSMAEWIGEVLSGKTSQFKMESTQLAQGLRAVRWRDLTLVENLGCSHSDKSQVGGDLTGIGGDLTGIGGGTSIKSNCSVRLDRSSLSDQRPWEMTPESELRMLDLFASVTDSSQSVSYLSLGNRRRSFADIFEFFVLLEKGWRPEVEKTSIIDARRTGKLPPIQRLTKPLSGQVSEILMWCDSSWSIGICQNQIRRYFADPFEVMNITMTTNAQMGMLSLFVPTETMNWFLHKLNNRTDPLTLTVHAHAITSFYALPNKNPDEYKNYYEVSSLECNQSDRDAIDALLQLRTPDFMDINTDIVIEFRTRLPLNEVLNIMPTCFKRKYALRDSSGDFKSHSSL